MVVSATASKRLAALRIKMRETGADLVALGPGAHMQWLVGFRPHPDDRPCLLLVGPEREAFLMPALNADAAREATDIAFHTWSDAEGPRSALTAALDATRAGTARQVVLDEAMRADFALMLLDALPGASHATAAGTVGALRMRKDDGDYAGLKANALIADRAMQAVLDAVKPGVSERELAALANVHFISEGAEPLFAIVAAGPNGAFPHHQSGDRSLQEGDVVVVDIGGRKGLFASDITRMAAVGSAPEGYQAVHDIVEIAVEAALETARPGVAAKDVDAAARGAISDAGFGAYFVHRTGHGLGIDVHEPPYITSTSETVLDTGMVFSIEPGIYLPDRFGVRLEDIVILRGGGPEILSERPRALMVAEA